MKAIQVTIDERLLQRLDSDSEVKRDGRSAVLRRAVEEYLRGKRNRQIADQYRKAYSGKPSAHDDWEAEEIWTDE